MNYLFLIAAVVFCVLSGLAGLTAGINLNPDSTVRYVPNWGSVGDWVSGVGALLAVAVALWQSYVSRRDEKEDLGVRAEYGTKAFIVVMVSRGKLPVRVLGVAFYSKKNDTILNVKHSIFKEYGLPRTLGYAEEHTLVTTPEGSAELARNVLRSFEDLSDLQLIVSTTLGRFNWSITLKDKDRLTQIGHEEQVS